MTPISAVSMSDHLQLPPCGAIGEILSIHKDYLNIAIADALFAFVRKGSPVVPFGVVVDFGSDWDTLDVDQQLEVKSEDDCIIVGDVITFIGLKECDRYSCRPIFKQVYDDAEIMRRLQYLHSFCRESPKNGGILTYLGQYQIDEGILQEVNPLGAIDQRIRRRFKALVSGIIGNNKSLIIEGAHGIMGVGPGLTPSGDDFLVGFLAGLMYCRPEKVAQAASVLARCLDQDSSVFTTTISAQYMKCAAKEQFHQYVAGLIEAFNAGTSGDLRKAAERLITLGHFSGTDLLLGFAYSGMIALQAARKDG